MNTNTNITHVKNMTKIAKDKMVQFDTCEKCGKTNLLPVCVSHGKYFDNWLNFKYSGYIETSSESDILR